MKVTNENKDDVMLSACLELEGLARRLNIKNLMPEVDEKAVAELIDKIEDQVELLIKVRDLGEEK